MSNIYQIVANCVNAFGARIHTLEQALIGSPEGSLRVQKRKNGCVYYFIDMGKKAEKRSEYLSKDNASLLKRYAEKKYAETVLPILKKNLKLYKRFLKLHTQKDECAAADTIDINILRLIPELARSPKLYCEQWAARPYPSHNTKYPEHLIHSTLRGELVRSKSEAMIADALQRHGIPYRYEYPLQLPGMQYPIYPDFTVLNKRTLQEFYWEHCGLLDDANYATSCVERFNAYCKAGFSQGKRLIISSETKEAPFSSSVAECMIKDFLV